MTEEPHGHIHVSIPTQPIPSLDEVLGRVPMGDETRIAALSQLREREDLILTEIQLAATHFGTYPEFVAFVLDVMSLGSPKDETTKTMLRDGFMRRMAWLQAGANPDDDPTPTNN